VKKRRIKGELPTAAPVEPGEGLVQKPEVKTSPRAQAPKPEANPAKAEKPDEGNNRQGPVLSDPLRYQIDPRDAVEKAEALNEMVRETRPDLAPEVDRIAKALDDIEVKMDGGEPEPEEVAGAPEAAEIPQPDGAAPAPEAGQPEIAEGEKVRVFMQEGTYEGTVTAINDDGTYEISTDDGMALNSVPASVLEHLPGERETMALPAAAKAQGTLINGFNANFLGQLLAASIGKAKAPQGYARVVKAMNKKKITSPEKLADLLANMGFKKTIVTAAAPAPTVSAAPKPEGEAAPAAAPAKPEGEAAAAAPAAAAPAAEDGATLQDEEDVIKALKAAGVKFYGSFHSRGSKNSVMPEVNVKVRSYKTPLVDALIEKNKVPENLREQVREHAFQDAQESFWRFWTEKGDGGFEEIAAIFGPDVNVSSTGRSGGHLVVDVSPLDFAEEQGDGSFKLDDKKVAAWIEVAKNIESGAEGEAIDGNMASQLEIDFEEGQFGGELGKWWDEAFKGHAEMRDKENAGQQSLPLESSYTIVRAFRDQKSPFQVVDMKSQKVKAKATSKEEAKKAKLAANKLRAEGKEPVEDTDGKPKTTDSPKKPAEPAEPLAAPKPKAETLPEAGGGAAPAKPAPPKAEPEVADAAGAGSEGPKGNPGPAEGKGGALPSAGGAAGPAKPAPGKIGSEPEQAVGGPIKVATYGSALAVYASVFDKIEELDLGGGMKALRAKPKKGEGEEGKEDSKPRVIVVDEEGKEKGNYPDAFGDDSPAVIKFFRELLNITDTKGGEEKGGKKKGEGEEPISSKPKALPNVEKKGEKGEGHVEEKDREALEAARKTLEARLGMVQQIVMAYREKGYIIADQDEIDAIQVEKQGKISLEAAVNEAVKRAAGRKQDELLAKSDSELLALQASLPHLQVKQMTVQASRNEGLPMLSLLVVDRPQSADGLSLNAAFSSHFMHLG
jgi:hypothetical protein